MSAADGGEWPGGHKSAAMSEPRQVLNDAEFLPRVFLWHSHPYVRTLKMLQ